MWLIKKFWSIVPKNYNFWTSLEHLNYSYDFIFLHQHGSQRDLPHPERGGWSQVPHASQVPWNYYLTAPKLKWYWKQMISKSRKMLFLLVQASHQPRLCHHQLHFHQHHGQGMIAQNSIKNKHVPIFCHPGWHRWLAADIPLCNTRFSCLHQCQCCNFPSMHRAHSLGKISFPLCLQISSF